MFLSAGYSGEYSKDEQSKSREKKQNQKPKIKSQNGRLKCKKDYSDVSDYRNYLRLQRLMEIMEVRTRDSLMCSDPSTGSG